MRGRKRQLFSAAGLILLVCCGGRESFGYGKTWMGQDLEQRIDAAALSLGPFRIRTLFDLSHAGYDTNVYRTPENPIGDFSIVGGPEFDVYLPLKKKAVISISESPQCVYFMETERERTWNHFFSGRVNLILNRVFIALGKGYSVAREIWNTEIDVRPKRKENSSQALLLWQMTKKTSWSFTFSHADRDFEDLSYGEFGIKDQLNHSESRVNLAGYHQVSFRTRLFLNAEYADFNFQSALNPRDSRSYAIFTGFEFSPAGVIRGRLSIGFKSFDILKPGNRDYRGIVGDASISVRVTKPLTLRTNYGRNVQFSSWYDHAYYLENIIGGGASLYVSARVRLDYNYAGGRNTYPAAAGDRPSSPERTDDYDSHQFGIYYRLKKNIGLGFIATRWKRDSTISWANGKQGVFGMNLTYDF